MSTLRHRPLSMVALGRYFGFPSCCVTAFFDHTDPDIGYGQACGQRKLHGTGFIPCSWCNLVKSEQHLMDEIASNRICPTPFPQEIDFETALHEILAHPDFSLDEKESVIEHLNWYLDAIGQFKTA